MIQIRKLVATDVALHGKVFIVGEFIVGVLGIGCLGVFSVIRGSIY